MNNKSSWNAPKRDKLEPHEVLKVAYAYLIGGVDQQTLATIFNITNSGRISEAVTVIRHACDNHMEIYRQLTGKKKEDE